MPTDNKSEIVIFKTADEKISVDVRFEGETVWLTQAQQGQWTFIENSNKRPDIFLFLNGLPICLFELKSPSREQTDASEADSMGVPVCCSRRSGYSRVCLKTRYKNGNAILAGSAIAPLPKGNGFAAATIPNAF